LIVGGLKASPNCLNNFDPFLRGHLEQFADRFIKKYPLEPRMTTEGNEAGSLQEIHVKRLIDPQEGINATNPKTTSSLLQVPIGPHSARTSGSSSKQRRCSRLASHSEERISMMEGRASGRA